MKYNREIRTPFKTVECVAFGSVVALVDEKHYIDDKSYLVSTIADYERENRLNITGKVVVLTNLESGRITFSPWGTKCVIVEDRNE